MTDTITVLVVDDEVQLQENLVAYLEDEGFTVVTAGDGEEALDILKNRNIEIGIVDIRLPRMDGNTFIYTAHKARPDMLFIIHTGSMNYAMPQQLKEIGLTDKDVFLKPIMDMNNLVNAIRTKLNKRT
jgi:DNA-binding NtrC family response regulator